MMCREMNNRTNKMNIPFKSQEVVEFKNYLYHNNELENFFKKV